MCSLLHSLDLRAVAGGGLMFLQRSGEFCAPAGFFVRDRLFRWVAVCSLLISCSLLASCGGSSNSNSPPPPPPPPPASNSPFWGQWGAGAQHNGAVNVAAQGLNRQLADLVYDRFV